MKKVFLSLLFVAATMFTYSQTVEEVMAKYEEANGGKNRLKAIYHFCEDIANADGVLVESERNLLNIARSILIN